MIDGISMEEAINNINSFIEYYNSGEWNKTGYVDKTELIKKIYFETAEGYDSPTIRTIIDFPSADVQPVKWISVDDRLPNIDERVLVYIPRPDNHYNIEIAYISEGNDNYPYWVLRDKSQFYSTRFHYISYWMPLPEPPKDGDVDE